MKAVRFKAIRASRTVVKKVCSAGPVSREGLDVFLKIRGNFILVVKNSVISFKPNAPNGCNDQVEKNNLFLSFQFCLANQLAQRGNRKTGRLPAKENIKIVPDI